MQITKFSPRGQASRKTNGIPRGFMAQAEEMRGKRSYKWWVIAMLWLICFFNYADRQAIFAVFPVLQKEFGFTTSQLGWIGSAFMWVYALGAPLAGVISDRVRRKDLILGGCIFWSLVTVMTGWCSKLWHFLTVRALEGFGETFYFPASMALASDYHGPKTRSRALAFHQSSVYIGTIGGSAIGAWFAEHIGWRWGFYFFGGFGLIVAIILYFFLHEPKRGQAELSPAELPPEPVPWTEAWATIFRSPPIVLLMLGFVAANFVATIFLSWTAYFLVEKFQFKLTTAGLSGTVFIHLASALSVPLAGYLADRWTQRTGGGRMFIQTMGLLLGAGFVYAVGAAGSTGLLLFVMTGFGFCKGFYDSGIFASLYDLVEPRMRGTVAGLMNTVGWTGGALGPVFVGYIAQYGPYGNQMENMSAAFSACSAIYVIGGALVLSAGLMTSHYLTPQRPAPH